MSLPPPWIALAVVAGFVATPLAVTPPGPADGGDPPRAFLRAGMGLTADEIARLDRGEVVTRSLLAPEPEDVGGLAVVRVAVARGVFLERFRLIETFKRASAVLKVGRFGTPPRLDDLAGLDVDVADLDAIADCRPGDCHIALTAADIERRRRELDPAHPSFRVRAARWYRERLVAIVSDYLARGNAALPVYASRRRPIPVAEHFATLAGQSHFLREHAPDLRRYLFEGPENRPPGVEEFVYWSKEKVGPKPVISLTHVVMYHDRVRPDHTVIASKQLYASHYFLASLGLTVVIDDPGADGRPGLLMAYMNHSRSDALTGFLGPLRRAIVRSRLRAGAQENLLAMRATLEATPPRE